MSMESWSTKSRRRKPPDVFTHLLTRPHRATYQDPTRPSEGIRYVLVNGTLVVKEGQLVEGVASGLAIRAARHKF